ncbi:MAG: PAS domain-containing protein [Acidobacteriaceae bacterium]
MNSETPLPASFGGDSSAPHHRAGGIRGAGEMASLVRTRDWTHTSLGAIDAWPEVLLCCVNTILASRFPMAIAWGPEMLQFYNDAYRPLIAEKHPAALGRSAAETWKEAWPVVGPQLEGALLRGNPTYRENVLLPVVRGGHLQDVYWTYSNSPIYDTSGEIAGVLSLCHDVTANILAERERRTLSAQLNQVLEATTDAVACVDRDWRITYMNPRAKAIGALQGDVLGLNLWESFPHAYYPGSLSVEHFTRAMDLGVAGEFEGFYPEPLNMWGDVHVRPTKDGIVIFFRDITAQKMTEKIASESAARLDAMFNTSMEYIGLLSTDGRLLDTNRASLEFAGNTREEVVGLYFWECPWFSYTPGAPEILRRLIARAAGGEYIRHEWPLTRPSGEVITFDFSLSPARNNEGEVVFLVPEGRDITAMKRAEAALKKSEKLAAAGRLAASIAHEINNPLEAVTNLLYLSLESRDMDQIRGYLQDAERELRRMSIISSQTLRFYRQSTRPSFVRPDELIASVLSLHQARTLNSRIHVEERLRAKEPIHCFDGEIRQVLSNLVGNATDSMRSEGGRLLLRSREGTYWRNGRKSLILTVADTGRGISPENQKKIFEPFFTTKGVSGTGLGLWVSQEIVERHKGRLYVRSSEQPGRSGTVFNLFLPYDGVS